ncbi:MAG: O-antigen ligase family protein [Candidatus Sumerlaeia bacterium]|nr:O-antigen ligase family protein [Candidatus Sumerlaeia bacterium]
MAADAGAARGRALLAAVFLLTVLGMTPYTARLDDVKELTAGVGGAALLCAALWWRPAGVPRGVRRALGFLAAFLAAHAASLVSAGLPFLGGGGMERWADPPTDALLLRRAAVLEGIPAAWGVLALSGVLVAGALFVRGAGAARGALRVAVAAVCATSLFGLFHYGGGFGALYAAMDRGGAGDGALGSMCFTFSRTREMLSTILNTQFFGSFLVALLPLCAGSLMLEFRAARALRAASQPAAAGMSAAAAAAFALAAGTLCAYFTYQKSTLLLLPVSLGLFALLAWRAGELRAPQRHRAEALAVAACALATLAFQAMLTKADLAQRLISMGASIGPRRIIFGGALAQWRDFPLLGSGPGSFVLYFPTYRAPDYLDHRISNVTAHAHNWALGLLAEVGLAGFLAFCALLAVAAGAGWRALRGAEEPERRLAAAALLAGLACYLVGNLAVPMSEWPVGALLMNALVGALLGVACWGPEPPRPAAPSLRATVALAAAAVLLVATAEQQARLFRAKTAHSEGLLLRREADRKAAGFAAGEPLPPAIRDDYARAIGHLERAARTAPGSDTMLYQLAYAYNRIGDSERALAAYEALRRVAPDYADVHYNLGVIRTTLALDRQDAGAPDDKVRALLDGGVAAFRRAAAQTDRVEFRQRLALALYMRARLAHGTDAAREDAREAALLYGEVVSGPDARRDDAQRLRENALRRAPESWEMAGDREAAARAHETHWRAEPGSVRALAAAWQGYRAAGLDAEAERLLAEAVARQPLLAPVRLLQYQRLKAADPARARRLLAFLLALGERMPRFLTDDESEMVRRELEAPGDPAPTEP